MSKSHQTPTIFTIGHSTRALDELIGLLSANGVKMLCDVRSFPRSRTNPQFNFESLAKALPDVDIAYTHMPELGGRRKPNEDSQNLGWRNLAFRGYADYLQTESFQSALNKLIELASEAPVAIMCSEAVPWRCHRFIISDALKARDITAYHIIGPKTPQPHKLSSFARLIGSSVVYPEENAS